MERFIASNATVIGDVTLSEDVTIWYQAVLRGDSNWIKIGQRTNIQDGTIIHVDHDAPVDIEFVQLLEGSHLEYEKENADFSLVEF